jgi:hypothetical protein
MTIDDRELDRRLAALTRHVEADESLWPGIERGLASDSRRPRRIAAAAAVGALSLGAALVALSVFDRTVPDEQGFAQRQAAVMRAAAPDAVAVSTVESSPRLGEAWRENQAAINELEQALKRDPDNGLLLEFLSEARLRQARLIQREIFPTKRSI